MATEPVPSQEEAPEAMSLDQIPESIQVYVCPGCSSWYGSSNASDLHEINNTRTSMRNLATEDPSEWGKVTGSRAICQKCAPAVIMERVLVTYVATPHLAQKLKEAVRAVPTD